MAEVIRDPEATVASQEADVAEIQRLNKERFELKLRLQKLDEKKTAAKPEIVEKVRRDYLSKLEQVESSLTEKSSGLKNQLERLESERKSILEKKATIDDDIEELELRHLVGEFAGELKESLEDAKHSDLNGILSSIKEIEEKISTISQLLNPEAPPPTFEKHEGPVKKVKAPPEEPKEKEEGSVSVEEASTDKTLKCPTCGTPNRHDNWYCEKCGRELLGVQQ